MEDITETMQETTRTKRAPKISNPEINKFKATLYKFANIEEFANIRPQIIDYIKDIEHDETIRNILFGTKYNKAETTGIIKELKKKPTKKSTKKASQQLEELEQIAKNTPLITTSTTTQPIIYTETELNQTKVFMLKQILELLSQNQTDITVKKLNKQQLIETILLLQNPAQEPLAQEPLAQEPPAQEPLTQEPDQKKKKRVVKKA